ncbi:putative Blue copper protein precursor [Hibiscus syriacus]|uniref:Blue copper protein n=1 Tax=Hibiscus syriacus TaxID=106335 RepID=A0A6A2XJ28_HIBSY|nr:putative Blue copper protein precursor [Hibiscus syriacus]
MIVIIRGPQLEHDLVNHGIRQSILVEALVAAAGFFDLSAREKLKFKSSDVYNPYGTRRASKTGLTRSSFGGFSSSIMHIPWTPGSIHGPTTRLTTVNCYPPCPEPNTALGLPPHSDYSCLTIVLQNSTDFEILDTEDGGNWTVVPEIRGTLQVHVGDHFEVLSNGIYKSAVHRATLNSESTRISIASLHSLGMDDKMEAAAELVDEQNPRRYRESSFKDFLDFLASDDIVDGKRFIDTLRA